MKALIQTLLLCLVMSQLCAQFQQQDYEALSALYLSTNGDNWENNIGWAEFIENPVLSSGEGENLNTLYGVTINTDGWVTGLVLSSNNLTGNIPPEIGTLTNLTFLQLSANELNGSIPTTIGNLDSLTHLDLSSNNLIGSIPTALGNLSNLTSLHLQNNSLSGCYNSNLDNLCDRLSYRSNEAISDGNNFDATWEDFCTFGVGACNITDMVLPGNFDNDATANGKDLLYWGVAHGYKGPDRPNSTTDWTPQNSPNWDNSVNGINSKHQDANGDGVVDTFDLDVLKNNYGETYGNNSFDYSSSDAMFVIEELEIDTTVVPYQIRFELHIDVPVSTHGISTTIDFSGVNYDSIQIDTIGSYLHPDAYIYRNKGNTIDIALTRTDKNDQNIDGPFVSLVVMVSDIQSLILPVVNNGYMMSATGELTSVSGSELYGQENARISLGVNDAYCDNKGTAKVYMANGAYSCVWSTEETTPSIEGLDIGTYYVTVNDGIRATKIPFEINWAPAPFDIHIGGDCVYFDFEQPLGEAVEVSLDGGYSYTPTAGDIDCFPIYNTDEIFIKPISDNCPTYVPVYVPPSYLSASIINSLGEVPILEYKLEQYGEVNINLYNIQGQQLQSLHEGLSGAGIHQININKKNVPRGIYFIRINYQSGNGNHTHTKTLKILM